MGYVDKEQASVDIKELYDRAECSFKEFKTSEYVQKRLKEMGLTDFKVVNTGIFGTIDVGKDKTVAVRSDMDALPYNEEGTEYRHLCGHHANMTTLLGILGAVVKNKTKLKYNLRYIFQPAEELVRGSVSMIEAGCMEGVSEVFGTHTSPDAELGSVILFSGGCMAGSYHFDITIRGKATHAAMPNRGTDTVTAACEFIMSMQTAITRLIDPTLPGLISFGKINGGTAANILPEEVRISGTYRYFDEEVKSTIENAMCTRLKSVEDFYNVKADLEIHEGTPPVICDVDITRKLKTVCEQQNIPVSPFDHKTMGGEDFAYYLKYAPGGYVWQGIRKGDLYSAPFHSKNYTVPEDAVYPCINLFAAYLLEG